MAEKKVLKSFRTGDKELRVEKFVFGSGSPVCGILSGVHGDEVLARKVSKRFMEVLEDRSLSGSVHIVPEANVFACDEDRRLTPWPKYEKNEGEMRDLNRCFEIAMENMSSQNSLNITQILARDILKDFKSMDFVLDLHNATSGGVKVNQARLKVSNGMSQEVISEMEDIAVNSGADFVMSSAPSWLGGTVSSILPLFGVPVVTFEVSGGGQHEKKDFEMYLKFLENVMKHRDIFEGDTVSNNPFFFDDIESIYSNSYGCLETYVDLGEFVDEGDVIAEIFSEKGVKKETVKSCFEGFVESLTDSEKVFEGTRIANIGLKEAFK